MVEFLWHVTGMYPDWYPQDMRYKRSIKARIFCEDFQKAGLQVILPTLEEWIDPTFVVKKVKNPIGFPIHWQLRNGSSFEVLTYEQKTASFEGWKGDLAWFDEPPPRDKYIATIRGLVDTGGRCMLTLTPLSQPWIFDEIVSNKEKHYAFSIFMDIRDNLIRTENGIRYGHLTEERILNFEKSLKPEEKEARLHGKFLHLTGLVYKQFDPSIHIVDEFKITDNCTRYFAIDPHPHTPTACLWLAVTENGDLVVYDELYLKDMDLKEIANAIKAQEGKYPAQVRIIDPAMDKDNMIMGGINVRKELMKYGIYTMRANTDFDYGKDCVDRALNPKWNSFMGKESPRMKVVGVNCPRLIYEFTHYIWEYKTKESGTPRQRPLKKDDHLVDCIRYILAADPRYIKPEEDGKEESAVTYKGDYARYAAPKETSGYYSLVEDRHETS